MIIQAIQGVYQAGDLEVVAATVSVAFDGSVSQMLTPLACGGKLVIAENLFALPADPHFDDITCLGAVPSLLEAFLEEYALPSSLRVLALGASSARAKVVEMLRLQGMSGLRLLNLYGPTEATVYCTVADLSHLLNVRDQKDITAELRVIGSPLPNIDAFVLDNELEIAPLGVAGELCIGGLAVARGYINRPELTDERFVEVSVHGAEVMRVYRTGDMARYNENWQLELLGRLDGQIKLRGYRVELGEIESALDMYRGIKKSVVALFNEGRNDAILVAYLIPDDKENPPASNQLREFLSISLPYYMLPTAYVVLDEFPLTASGKVDRTALREPQRHELTGGQQMEQATSDIEQQMLAIWCGVLSKEDISLDDDFFALGGNSIDALRLINALQQNLGVQLQFNDLFEAATPRGCAVRLTQLARLQDEADLLLHSEDSR
jgi:acyl-CoA synthetase (AMP-forming)/AMP-acid ligase II/acyl carrier protein